MTAHANRHAGPDAPIAHPCPGRCRSLTTQVKDGGGVRITSDDDGAGDLGRMMAGATSTATRSHGRSRSRSRAAARLVVSLPWTRPPAA